MAPSTSSDEEAVFSRSRSHVAPLAAFHDECLIFAPLSSSKCQQSSWLKDEATPETPCTDVDETDSVVTDFDLDGTQCSDDKMLHQSNTDVVFCLSQLVALQMAIRCSISRVCVALPSETIARDCQLKLEEMWQHSFITVNKYADTAERVATMVFPDFKLAIHEGEQGLAESLLDMVRRWVEEMKQDGEGMKLRQTALLNRLDDLATCSAAVETVRSEVSQAAASLRQSIAIVDQCCAFWASMVSSLEMDWLLQELASDFVAQGVQARPDAHLDEFISFWESLACLCKQYCKDLSIEIKATFTEALAR